MNIELLPIAEKKIRQMGGEAMGVVVRRDDGILVAVTDSGRVTRLDDAVAGPVRDGAKGAEPVAEYTFYLDSGIRFFPLNAFDNLPKGKGYLYARPQPAQQGAVPEALRNALSAAIGVAHDRKGDVSDEDGNYATTPVDNMIELETALCELFDTGSDDVLAHEMLPKMDTLLSTNTTSPEPRPLPNNRFGVDRDYFTKKLEIIIRDMRDYIPAELARSLARLAAVADGEVLQEAEFNTTSPDTNPEACYWHGDDSGCWKGSCGIEWYFEDGGPDENGVNHCPRCGRARVNEEQEGER